MKTRIERDTLGEMRVPAGAYYGAQTARAVENFAISGERFPRRFIMALGAIKHAAAEVNRELELLDERRAEAIKQAAEEVVQGALDDQFVVDIFQTGSGTSTNMNANEVVASRANELLGGKRGGREPVHPNDHVNLGQSSNDTFPTAIHVAVALQADKELLPALGGLHVALVQKASDWDDVVKVGRTHLMDAMPIRLGQVASGWAAQVALSIERLQQSLARLHALPQGGTAVGTGSGTHPEFGARVAGKLSDRFGLQFTEAANHFEAQHARDATAEIAGQLSTIATSLLKIANDVRWLSSGPRSGLGELQLPAIQPGSSIMPAKVNPVMAESLMMACAQVMGNGVTVQVANSHGNLELNVMMPVIARNLLGSMVVLGGAVLAFTERALVGAQPSPDAEVRVDRLLALATALVPAVGYDRAAEVAKRAAREERTILEVALDEQILPEPELRRLLDPRRLTEPGLPGSDGARPVSTSK